MQHFRLLPNLSI